GRGCWRISPWGRSRPRPWLSTGRWRLSAMHIAINAQLMSSASGYRDAGVSNYCRQLLIALGELGISGATYHQFSAFIHTPDVVIPGIDLHYSSPALEQPLRRIVWEQTALPWRLARAKRRVDLVH